MMARSMAERVLRQNLEAARARFESRRGPFMDLPGEDVPVEFDDIEP